MRDEDEKVRKEQKQNSGRDHTQNRPLKCFFSMTIQKLRMYKKADRLEGEQQSGVICLCCYFICTVGWRICKEQIRKLKLPSAGAGTQACEKYKRDARLQVQPAQAHPLSSQPRAAARGPSLGLTYSGTKMTLSHEDGNS